MSGALLRTHDNVRYVKLESAIPASSQTALSGNGVVGSLSPAHPSRTRRESKVPRMVITHAVEDIERWLAGKAQRAAVIESGTGSNVTDYVAADGSNNIAVTADVADVESVKAMLASPPADVLASMQAHGVVPPLTAYIEA
jgi:hypothetical protein